MAQGGEKPTTSLQHAIFDPWLVPRLSRPRRDHGRAVMLDQRGITGVDHRVVIGGVGDADLQIVGYHLRRYAAQEGEPTDMRAKPVLRRLCPTGLGVD